MSKLRSGMMCVGVMVAALAITACRDGGDASPTPAATATVTAEPTAPSTQPPATPTASLDALSADVSAAYLAYWDAYAEAVLNLDASLVEGFAVGDELEAIREEIDTLRADGVAARIVVEHDFEIVSLTPTEAVVIDEYVNNSFYVNPETKEPEEADGPGDLIRESIFLERIGEGWAVTRSVREASD